MGGWREIPGPVIPQVGDVFYLILLGHGTPAYSFIQDFCLGLLFCYCDKLLSPKGAWEGKDLCQLTLPLNHR